MDAEGYVKITGRIRDLIIRGGENIHPLEIEDCLLGCPDISDASIVGIGDDRYGEAVCAFVIVKHGRNTIAEDVRTWVRKRMSHQLSEDKYSVKVCHCS